MGAVPELGRVDAVHDVAVGLHASFGVSVAAQGRIAAHDVGPGVQPGLSAGRGVYPLDDLARTGARLLSRGTGQGQGHQQCRAERGQGTTHVPHGFTPFLEIRLHLAAAGSRGGSGAMRGISSVTIQADTMCISDTTTNTGVYE